MKAYHARALLLSVLGFAASLANAGQQNPKLNPVRPPAPETGSPFAFIHRGLGREARGDLDGAIADFTRALELDPKSIFALNNRGRVKQAKGDLDGALSDFSEAIGIDPIYADAWYNHGRAERDKGDLNAALTDYNRTLNLDPKFLDTYIRRGNIKKAMGDFDGALADFRRCEKLADPDWKDYARINVWLVRAEKGECVQASAALSTYLSRRASRPQGDWAAKIIGFLLDRISEADFLASVPPKDQGRRCKAWYYAGMKRLLAGNKAKASDYFLQCVATGQWDFDEYQFAKAELKALDRSAGL